MAGIKAKYISKLRKKAKLMQTYRVRESYGLFGFDTIRNNEYMEIRAISEYVAMQRFFEHYQKTEKRVHRFHDSEQVTTYQWGRIEVVDENGYKTYFR